MLRTGHIIDILYLVNTMSLAFRVFTFTDLNVYS